MIIWDGSMEARMFRGLLTGLLACACLVALAPSPALAQNPGPDAADDKEARDLFQIGKEAFDEGRFERALKYFQDAYDLSHRAALLSNIGTALDRLRRDQEAVDVYKKYLEQVPQASNRRLIEQRIRIIESALAKSKPAPPAAVQVEPVSAAQPTAAASLPSMTKAPEAPQPVKAELTAPTPAETARAAEPVSAPNDARHPIDTETTPITSRWWFWTGIGAVAIAAVVVVVAVSAGGGDAASNEPQKPAVLDPTTRVRQL
ncbi:MAG TPA: hypothetical protein VFN67_31990 [Polyangiales bacterium]|nr:hypothetical protein [Polyangiales bacterium]